ncbi:MAG: N-acetyltransferase [Thalassovita sp.]
MPIRPATPEDCDTIADIYNHAVRTTVAILNDVEVDADNRRDWLSMRRAAGFPVIVATNGEGDTVLGYASYGAWRPFDGFRDTVEHSVYVAETAQGQGLGKTLMQALITEARKQQIHVMVAGIEAGNTASIQLHKTLGFEQTALMPQVGQKFGRWLDLAFLQLQLDTRAAP